MDLIKADENGELHLKSLVPGAYYEPELMTADEIKLRRVHPSGSRKMTRSETLAALERSPLRFRRSWDDLKHETRE